MAPVSIVIVTYNGRELMARCLDEVLAQAHQVDAEVIVVDNASADGTADYLRETFPQIVLVQNPCNLGFAEGCNVGVRAARGELIVLLNNDARPRPGWLRALLAPLDADDVAISCSVIREERYDPAYELGTGSISVIGHPIPNVATDLEQPFYATGCSLAFKRSVLGEPFDPAYFAYYEDTLLSWRARLLGYRVVRALTSEVDHLGSVTAQRRPALMRYYWERNKLLTLLCCYEGTTIARLLPLYLFDGVARVAEDLWLLAKRPSLPGRTAGEVLARYRATSRALRWLATNADFVRERRSSIQRVRQRGDREITTRLSGKIFDDLVPTMGHRVANALAQLYCRLVGVQTADQSYQRPRRGKMAANRAALPPP